MRIFRAIVALAAPLKSVQFNVLFVVAFLLSHAEKKSSGDKKKLPQRITVGRTVQCTLPKYFQLNYFVNIDIIYIKNIKNKKLNESKL